MRAIRFLPLLFFILLGAGCQGASPNFTDNTRAQIVFAADFANNQGCDTHSNKGCDIFFADILLDGTVNEVRQLTARKEIETFPVFSADNLYVYANVLKNKGQWDISWTNLLTGDVGILQTNARNPAVFSDGTALAYITADDENITLADFANPTSLQGERAITTDGGYHELSIAPNDTLVFYQLFGEGQGSRSAQARLYSPVSDTFTNLTPSDGTAHCFWNADGSEVLCNNKDFYRGIGSIPVSGATVGDASLAIPHPKLKEITAIDPDYANCKAVHFAYGAFCDETRLIATLGCSTKTEDGLKTTLSKLALLDLATSPATILPLGTSLANTFGGPGESSYTVDCILPI